MKKTTLTILVIVGILILIGFISSFSYQLGGKRGEEKIKTEYPIIELMKSKVIRSWNATATGEIVEISDRTLTLVSEGEILKIPIEEGARVGIFVAPEEEARPEWQEREFGDLKAGDKVDVFSRVKPTGELEGIGITILSQ